MFSQNTRVESFRNPYVRRFLRQSHKQLFESLVQKYGRDESELIIEFKLSLRIGAQVKTKYRHSYR